jgi:hypothetical protein
VRKVPRRRWIRISRLNRCFDSKWERRTSLFEEHVEGMPEQRATFKGRDNGLAQVRARAIAPLAAPTRGIELNAKGLVAAKDGTTAAGSLDAP